MHKVKVADTRLKIPGAPPFSIFLDDDLKRGVFRLQTPESVMSLCDLTDFGAKPLIARSVSVRYNDILKSWGPARVACIENRFGWSENICEIVRRINPGHAANSDFPTHVLVFATDADGNAPKGHDLLSPSTYEEALEGKPTSKEPRSTNDGRTFTYHPIGATLTPDGKPLTARCEPLYANSRRCRATYRLSGLTHVDVEFAAANGDLERKLLAVQDKAHLLLDQLR